MLRPPGWSVYGKQATDRCSARLLARCTATAIVTAQLTLCFAWCVLLHFRLLVGQAILKREQVVLARAGVSADGAVVTDAGAAAGAGAGATDLEDSINQAPSEGGEGAVSNAKVDALVRAAVAKANARNAATVRDLKKENARLTVELAKVCMRACVL